MTGLSVGSKCDYWRAELGGGYLKLNGAYETLKKRIP